MNEIDHVQDRKESRERTGDSMDAATNPLPWQVPFNWRRVRALSPENDEGHTDGLLVYWASTQFRDDWGRMFLMCSHE